MAPYLQIAEILRAEISSGKLASGSRITESDLQKRFEVARTTARRALEVLRRDGLIETVPTRGSYVL